jgi:hypothetical protein
MQQIHKVVQSNGGALLKSGIARRAAYEAANRGRAHLHEPLCASKCHFKCSGSAQGCWDGSLCVRFVSLALSLTRQLMSLM